MYDKNNVFAKIIRGEIPSKKICENDYAISFYDIDPTATKHALVIPKGDYVDIFDFVSNSSTNEQIGFWQLTNDTAEKIGIRENSNILINVGEGVYFKQSVKHFHLHLVGGEKIKPVSDLK